MNASVTSADRGAAPHMRMRKDERSYFPRLFEWSRTMTIGGTMQANEILYFSIALRTDVSSKRGRMTRGHAIVNGRRRRMVRPKMWLRGRISRTTSLVGSRIEKVELTAWSWDVML
jgi:hypothetical protein